MRKRTSLLPVLVTLSLLAGCIAGTDRFVGPVTGCGIDTIGVLDIRGAEFVFTPDQGTMQIHGTVTKDNQLQGTEAAGPANAREHDTISFAGARARHTVTGTLTRPTCALVLTLQER